MMLFRTVVSPANIVAASDYEGPAVAEILFHGATSDRWTSLRNFGYWLDLSKPLYLHY